MTMQLVWGELPYYHPRTGTMQYLTEDSFTVRSGTAPAAWRHWRDNDKIFSAMATWGATSGGLSIAHVLDDSIPFEADILARIRRQELFWSYGDGAHPDATRQAIAAFGNKTMSHELRPLTRVTFDHVSYVEVAAFYQEAIRCVGDGLAQWGRELAALRTAYR